MNDQEKIDQSILDAFKVNEQLSKCMLDAYLIVNRSGKILKSNQLFY